MRKIYPIIDAVTATTIAEPIYIGNAKKVVLVGKRADHSAGSSAFAATVGIGASLADDGLISADYKKWISNVANSNTQELTRTQTLTLSANGVDFVTMCPEDSFEYVTVTVTETTDGTHSAWLVVEFDDDVK